MVGDERRQVPNRPPPRPLVDFRSRETYTFDARGYVPFALSATVIVLRRSTTGAIDSAGDPVPTVLRRAEMATDSRGGVGGIAPLFATLGDTIEFKGGWEVLAGQSLVVNYLKSNRPDDVQLMRYPGEFKLPGGRLDPGETAEIAARRELAEEFLLSHDQVASAKLVPVQIRQTRQIRGRSDMIVAFATVVGSDANSQHRRGLGSIDVDAINARLAAKEEAAAKLLASGEWSGLSPAARAELSPEMHEVQWVPLPELVRIMQKSIAAELHPINAWQAAEFAEHGVVERDPMSVTLAALLACEFGAGSEMLHGRRKVPELAAALADESFRFSANLENICLDTRDVASKL